MASRRLIIPDRLVDYGIKLGSDQRKDLEDRELFPRRVAVTARTYAYVEDEIIDYVTGKIAARDSRGKAA